MSDKSERLRRLLGRMFQPHLWQGISTGEGWPESVTARLRLLQEALSED